MKNSILAATAGAAAFLSASFAPVQAGVVGPMSTATKAQMGTEMIHEVGRRRRNRHRGYGIGAGIVTLGILGAIAANRSARANDYYYEERRYRPRHRYSYRNKCRRWLRRCRHGNDRACWRYDTRC
ncbi:MAG: hypothetical protein JXQ99_07100 [Hyphomicrobiaceae bacterium]